MSSINTNLSAMTALQSLKMTQTSLNKTQNQISTGLRVSEASHNASYWSIATAMKSDNGALGAVKDSISQSKAMINTFTSAMDKSLTYLNKMKEGLVAASQPGADLKKIQTEFNAHIEGMKSAAGSAAFNGQNWLAGTPDTVKLVTSYDGNSQSVGTLSIDTSKTKLFADAASGTGGILHDVAAVDITTNTEVRLDISSMKNGDKISLSVDGGAAKEYVIGTNAADTTDTTGATLLASLNAAGVFGTDVEAKLDDNGDLRLISKDLSKSVAAAFLSDQGDTAPTTVAVGDATTKGAVDIKIDSSKISAGDTISIDVDDVVGATATASYKFTVSKEATLADVAKSINDDTANTTGIVASVVDGKLRLTAGAVGFSLITSAASVGYSNYDRTAGEMPVVADALKAVDEAIAKVTEGSATLGANKNLLETQEEFISTLSDSLTAGVSAFIDADMNEVSTRNQALQTQQQLGVQALSIANQNSQMILRLFQ